MQSILRNARIQKRMKSGLSQLPLVFPLGPVEEEVAAESQKRECACGGNRRRTPCIQENPALLRVSSRNPSRWVGHVRLTWRVTKISIWL